MEMTKLDTFIIPVLCTSPRELMAGAVRRGRTRVSLIPARVHHPQGLHVRRHPLRKKILYDILSPNLRSPLQHRSRTRNSILNPPPLSTTGGTQISLDEQPHHLKVLPLNRDHDRDSTLCSRIPPVTQQKLDERHSSCHHRFREGVAVVHVALRGSCDRAPRMV